MKSHRFAFVASLVLAWGAFAPTAPGQSPVSFESPAALAPPPATAAVLAARSPLNASDLRLIQSQLQRVIPRILPATVSVELGRAAGSGVIISRDGLVLTAAHVIGRPGRIAWVELPDGRRFRGRTLGANHEADAGMLRLEEPPADLPFAPLAEGGPLTDGQWVITTGQPGGIVSDRAPPIRLGRVLAVLDDMVCTDCKLVGGDSGGPLFNMNGEVVGVHSSIGPLVTHNFHVPATSFKTSWDRLLAGELWGGRFDELADRSRPYLGVAGRTENGRCVVTHVYPAMPAAGVGIEVGDVIVAVNGRPIDSFEQLSNIVAFKTPGQKLTVTVQRGVVNMEMLVQLAAAPPPSTDED